MKVSLENQALFVITQLIATLYLP